MIKAGITLHFKHEGFQKREVRTYTILKGQETRIREAISESAILKHWRGWILEFTETPMRILYLLICLYERLANYGHEKNWPACFCVMCGWRIDFFFSVQFSLSVMSDSLRPHEPQHARPPCPSPTPRVHPNPCPLSWWCHPSISSSVVPFSSCPKSFPESGSFQRVSSSHQVAQVLEFHLQHQAFQWTCRTDLL